MKKLLLLLCALLGTVGAMATEVVINASTGSLNSNWGNTWTSTDEPTFTLTAFQNTALRGNMQVNGTGLDLWTGAQASYNSKYFSIYTISAPEGSIITSYTFDFVSKDGTEMTVTPAVGGEAKSNTSTSDAVTVSATGLSSNVAQFFLSAPANKGLNTAGITVTYESGTTSNSGTAITSASSLANNKMYTITNGRGTMVYDALYNALTSTGEGYSSKLDAANDLARFAIISYEDNLYLWNVAAKGFVVKNGGYTSFSQIPTSIYFQTGTYDSDHTFVFTLAGGSQMAISNGYHPAVITSWNDLSDQGNCAAITEVGDFDATEVLAILNDYFHPSYTVTYVVKDGSNNVLFTSDPVGTTNGANITTLPEEFQLTNFYTYNTVNVTISTSGNTNVEFTATPIENPLVKYTADASNPYYYNLNIRSKYLVYNSEATGEVTLQNESEPFNANASWAFIGEPYAGFKVINKTKGTGYFLTYTSVVTGGNGGSDGSNNNVQFVASADFNDRYWIIDKNNGGFCLRMKENTNIYFHHQNISGSNGYLRTCSVSEWSAVHNDAGSTIVASTDEDVLFALYDSMKDYSFGTAIGQMNTTDASVVSNEDAAATIAGVGAAISASQTAAYADCYNALNTLAANIALITPTAGYYRLKNWVTGGYLTAVKATAWNSTEKSVYADSDATNAATVIRLYDKDNDGHLYMYNQGHGFGWTVVNGEQGGGMAWVTSTPDKYVNWFPGNAAGQIAFAICYGNGTGGYASYLKKGIYTADTDNAVIAGADYKEGAAQWIVEEATDIKVTISDAGYATLYVPFAVTIPENVTVSTISEINGNALTLSPVSGTIPAGTPVVLEGEAGTYTFAIDADNTAAAFTNSLTGTYFKMAAPNGSYILQSQDDKVGFYQVDTQQYQPNVPANRAYLPATDGDVKAFFFGEEDTIKSLTPNPSPVGEGSIYNVAGQRMNRLQRGVNIVNGTKIIVK